MATTVVAPLEDDTLGSLASFKDRYSKDDTITTDKINDLLGYF